MGGRSRSHEGDRLRDLLHDDGGGRPGQVAAQDRRSHHLGRTHQPGEGRAIRHCRGGQDPRRAREVVAEDFSQGGWGNNSM